MRVHLSLLAAILTLIVAAPAAAQLGLPGVRGVGVPEAGPLLDPVLREVQDLPGSVARETIQLAEQRLERLDRLLRRNRDAVERDRFGEPARRGELLVMDVDIVGIESAVNFGFAVIERSEIEGLGIDMVRLALPRGTSLEEGARQLEQLLPRATVSADNLYFQSGGSVPAVSVQAPSNGGRSRAVAVGMIDGAPGDAVRVASTRGFANGAPAASNHGSAVASLLRSAGVRQVYVADVYGTDAAGGNASAIARGLGWLVEQGARVITISLVGPDNPLLQRAIAGAHRRGVLGVAAVGNDGPAAPPAYPASYDGVIAVTAVDGRERALIEAGRALHLDYAAPGADIYGLDRRGRSQRLRGTSYATPLVAARLAATLGVGGDWRSVLDREARDLGERGPDPVYGRGLVCRGCGARD